MKHWPDIPGQTGLAVAAAWHDVGVVVVVVVVVEAEVVVSASVVVLLTYVVYCGSLMAE